MQPLICGSESGRLVEDWWKIGGRLVDMGHLKVGVL
jgi:hypothetical protein